ncbi:MAG: glycosyltransferase family 4 protein [Steroidobacteraceae bacterium]
MIAVVYPQFYAVGGIARYIDSFLSNIAPGSPPVTLITGGTPPSQAPAYAGVQIIHIGDPGMDRAGLLGWGLRVRKLLRRLHAEGRVRCVNFHAPPLIPGLLLPPQIPVVLTAHTTYLGMSGRFYQQRHFESQWSASSLAVKLAMERRLFATASKVVALTEQARAEVSSYGYKGPIAVIPNGADTRSFRPDPAAAKTVDVLFGGRIEKRKGSRSMVQLCKALVEARPAIRIVIVGYGDDDVWVRRELEPLAPAVQLAGKVPFERMRDYYSRSRVYASTSYYEGLPGTCLEAMAMGLPAVVWDFLFYRGLVLDGQTGLVAAPNDIECMKTQVLQLLDHPEAARRMGDKARHILESGYQWRHLAPRVMAELESTL